MCGISSAFSRAFSLLCFGVALGLSFWLGGYVVKLVLLVYGGVEISEVPYAAALDHDFWKYNLTYSLVFTGIVFGGVVAFVVAIWLLERCMGVLWLAFWGSVCPCCFPDRMERGLGSRGSGGSDDGGPYTVVNHHYYDGADGWSAREAPSPVGPPTTPQYSLRPMGTMSTSLATLGRMPARTTPAAPMPKGRFVV